MARDGGSVRSCEELGWREGDTVREGEKVGRAPGMAGGCRGGSVRVAHTFQTKCGCNSE